MSKMILKYFDAKGVVEASRIMLAVAKADYEDMRFPIAMKEGGGYAMPEFDAAKAVGEFAVNLDRLPILIDGSLVLGQSASISKYIAKKHNFYGSSSSEEALIDMICEHVRDVKQKYTDSKRGKTGDLVNDAKKEWLRGEYVTLMTKVDACLDGTNGFALGGKVSLADFTLYTLIHEYFDDKEIAIESIAACSKIIASTNKVLELAAEYLAARPKSNF